MCSCLQGDQTPRYLSKCLLDRFWCRRYFLFQNDFACFIQNTVERPAVSQIQSNRELVLFENLHPLYRHSANLHCRSPLRLERVVHWERIASRWRPAFSSHLINAVTGNLPSLSGNATNQANGIVFFEDYSELPMNRPEPAYVLSPTPCLRLAPNYVSSPYRNSSGVNSARFRLHTNQVCIPGVSISVTFTPFLLSHSRRFRLTVIRRSAVPHAIQSRWNC